MRKPYFLPTLGALLAKQGRPFLHRDLSWLQFNERVLSQARSPANPLLERARFLAITAANLDEFFMIRFPSILREAGERGIRGRILDAVIRFEAKQTETFELLRKELGGLGLHLAAASSKDDPASLHHRELFERLVLPELRPLPSSPWRTLQNLQMAAVFLDGPWVAIPRSLPSVFVEAVRGRSGVHITFLDHLIAEHLGAALGLGERPGLVRLTRDGDFAVEIHSDDPESIPDRVRSSVLHREQGRPLRLEYSPDTDPAVLARALAALRLDSGQAIAARASLALSGLQRAVGQIPAQVRADSRLCFPPANSFVPFPFRTTAGVFERLQQEDLLLHHPYDSFESYLNWIRAACADPDVTAIEQTIYRTDGYGPLFEALAAAAGRKRIRVVIEPRARFDELNNLRITSELKRAGVDVSFGFGRLKLHAKIAAVTRRESGGDRVYTHLSTGNYNSSTARHYTDLAILTANAAIGQDARQFFDAVMNGRLPVGLTTLVPAPASLHRRLRALIAREIAAVRTGGAGRIFAKVNALVDEVMIRDLYRASQAGVQVDLVVRGACSLIPGVRGLSDHVRVTALVDRYLEHSRIYAFGASGAIWLSSADWMPRNFFSRLELAFPVLDPQLRRYLREVVIPAYLCDTAKARELTSEGTWKKKVAPTPGASLPGAALEGTRFVGRPLRCQFFFEDLAAKGYAGTSLQHRMAETQAAPAESRRSPLRTPRLR